MSDGKDKPVIEEIDCIEAINGLYAYLDGELGPHETARFEHHLEHCRVCYTRTELETALSRRIRESARGQVPASLQRRLRKLLDDI